MRVGSESYVNHGQLRAAIVHERLAAGESPRSVRDGVVEAHVAAGEKFNSADAVGTVGNVGAVGTITAAGGVSGPRAIGEASLEPSVVVDMPWKEEADAAIALVESRHGGEPMSDAMKDRIYADFAGRAAGLEPQAPRGMPTWKAWANVDAAVEKLQEAANSAPNDTGTTGTGDGGTVTGSTGTITSAGSTGPTPEPSPEPAGEPTLSSGGEASGTTASGTTADATTVDATNLDATTVDATTVDATTAGDGTTV